eukprot:1158996-Pelagomonas_calceolata.AAC.2
MHARADAMSCFAGVEGGKFTNSGRPAGRYHAAESPLFSDNESQMSDVRQFKSITEMGQAKPKEVLGSSLATAYSHPVTLVRCGHSAGDGCVWAQHVSMKLVCVCSCMRVVVVVFV